MFHMAEIPEIRRRGASPTHRVDPELRAPRSKWILERHDHAEHHPVPRNQRMRFWRWMDELQKRWEKPLIVLSLQNLTQGGTVIAGTVLIAASVEPPNRRYGSKGPGCVKCKEPVPVAPESKIPTEWIRPVDPANAPMKLRSLSIACMMCQKCQHETDAAAGVAQATLSNPADFAKAILGLLDLLLPSEGKSDVSEVGSSDEDGVRLRAQG